MYRIENVFMLGRYEHARSLPPLPYFGGWVYRAFPGAVDRSSVARICGGFWDHLAPGVVDYDRVYAAIRNDDAVFHLSLIHI